METFDELSSESLSLLLFTYLVDENNIHIF